MEETYLRHGNKADIRVSITYETSVQIYELDTEIYDDCQSHLKESDVQSGDGRQRTNRSKDSLGVFWIAWLSELVSDAVGDS